MEKRNQGFLLSHWIILENAKDLNEIVTSSLHWDNRRSQTNYTPSSVISPRRCTVESLPGWKCKPGFPDFTWLSWADEGPDRHFSSGAVGNPHSVETPKSTFSNVGCYRVHRSGRSGAIVDIGVSGTLKPLINFFESTSSELSGIYNNSSEKNVSLYFSRGACGPKCVSARLCVVFQIKKGKAKKKDSRLRIPVAFSDASRNRRSQSIRDTC